MKIKRLIYIALLAVIIISFLHDNIYTKEMLAGTYIYYYPMSGPERPSEGNKLWLKKDGTFQSDTWGNGFYDINGSKLHLNYGNAGYQMTIYRPMFWGRARFSIIRDLNYAFERID